MVHLQTPATAKEMKLVELVLDVNIKAISTWLIKASPEINRYLAETFPVSGFRSIYRAASVNY
jgi:hypothetical protein